jgi:hypothetical protein
VERKTGVRSIDEPQALVVAPRAPLVQPFEHRLPNSAAPEKGEPRNVILRRQGRRHRLRRTKAFSG